MSEVTITVSETARQKLQELAEQSGRSIAEVLERAVEAYHNRQFWEAVDKGYAELRADARSVGRRRGRAPRLGRHPDGRNAKPQ